SVPPEEHSESAGPLARWSGHQHIDVGINPGLIPRLFEFERGLRGIHRLLFLLNFLGQDADFRKTVFHLSAIVRSLGSDVGTPLEQL
ncbi:MAG: hypothetical protein WBW60_19500, partial [Candidatus Sulfotelmatobacter sp.]